MDQMKLHKLVYFAHGWSLGLLDRELINEEIEAWDYGPVVPSLYQEFKEFGSRQITRTATEWKIEGTTIKPFTPVIDAAEGWQLPFLERIWKTYGKKSGIELSGLTHLPGSPWTRIRKENPNIRGVGIPNEIIKDYFKKRAN